MNKTTAVNIIKKANICTLASWINLDLRHWFDTFSTRTQENHRTENTGDMKPRTGITNNNLYTVEVD